MLQPVAVVSAHKGDVNCCCFSPNGKLIATASGDHTVRLFESSNGREVDQSPLRGHQFYVNVCVFSPDGRILASGSTDGKVKLWSTETCKEIGEWGDVGKNDWTGSVRASLSVMSVCLSIKHIYLNILSIIHFRNVNNYICCPTTINVRKLN